MLENGGNIKNNQLSLANMCYIVFLMMRLLNIPYSFINFHQHVVNRENSPVVLSHPGDLVIQNIQWRLLYTVEGPHFVINALPTTLQSGPTITNIKY